MEQVADNIIGLGSPKYDNAYWEVSYLRIYVASDLAATSGTATPSSTSTPVISASRTLNTPVVSSPVGISPTSGAQVSRRLSRNLTVTFIAVIIGYLF
jgi:hypothetical protein